MKKLTILFVTALFLATTAASSLWAGGATATAVSGAGAGAFPGGTIYNGVELSGSRFGKGVILYPNGSAIGDFTSILTGTTPIGMRYITVTGLVTSGSSSGDSATFGGSASVDMGDGTSLSVPFSVTVTRQGITLALGSTTLPTQMLTDGSIEIAPW